MMGEGITYQARQRVRIQCPDCGEDMTAGLLEVHRQTYNVVDLGGIRQWETPLPDREPQTYWM